MRAAARQCLTLVLFVAAGIAFAAAWTYHHDTWPGPHPRAMEQLEQRQANADAGEPPAWRAIRLPDDLPPALNLPEIMNRLRAAGVARLSIDLQSVANLYPNVDAAREATTGLFAEPLPIAGRTLGEVLDDVAERQQWPADVQWAETNERRVDVPDLRLRAGSEQLYVPRAAYPAGVTVRGDLDRLRDRWWGVDRWLYWNHGAGQPIAGAAGVAAGTPASDYLETLRISLRLRNEMAVGNTPPPPEVSITMMMRAAGTGNFNVITRGLQLSGPSESVAYGVDLIWRITLEAFLIDLVTGATLGLLLGMVFVVSRLIFRRLLRGRRRERRGLCRRCGYDLRESPERCPECGQPAGAGRRVIAAA